MIAEISVVICASRIVRNEFSGALSERTLHASSVIHRIFDAFKCQNVGVDRHTDAQYERSDTGERKDGPHRIVQQEDDKDVDRQCDRGDHARQTVDADHEQHDCRNADRTGKHRRRECPQPVIRRYDIRILLGQLHRQGSGIDEILQLRCAFLREVSADLRTVAADPL